MQYPGTTSPFGSGLSVGANTLANGLNSPQSLEARKAALVRQMVLGNGQRTGHPSIGGPGGGVLHGGMGMPGVGPYAAGLVSGSNSAAIAANGGGMFYGQHGQPTPSGPSPAQISTGMASPSPSPAAAQSPAPAQTSGQPIYGLFNAKISPNQIPGGISGGYDPANSLSPAVIAAILANHTRG